MWTPVWFIKYPSFSPYVTRFTKAQHNDAFFEIQIFTLMSSIYLKLCSIVILILYYKYFSSYKIRLQEKQYISFVRIPMVINITHILIMFMDTLIAMWS